MSVPLEITCVTPIQTVLILMEAIGVSVFQALMVMASTAQVSCSCYSSSHYLVLFPLPDIDECSSSDMNNCSFHANCSDTTGSYGCTCSVGYTGDGFSCEGKERLCLCHLSCFTADIDECSNTTEYPCHSQANCSNTDGSFVCSCLNGYTGDGISCKGTVPSLQYIC